MSRRHARLLTVAILSFALLMASGCAKETELHTITDARGLFHVKVPAGWSSQVQEGIIAIYADETPPASEKLEDLTIGVFSTSETTDSPVADALTYVVERRAADRGWTGSEISEPAATEIGGRSGVVITARGTDGQGVAFDALYYFARTSGNEFLVIAAAPSSQWDEHRKSVEDLVADQWFWHLPADAETTETVQ